MAGKHENGGSKRVLKGHFVVYVGEELKRYVIPLSFLKNPSFQQLLQKAADEYGFDGRKSIILPCEEHTFLRIMDISTSSA